MGNSKSRLATNHGKVGCLVCSHANRFAIERSWLVEKKSLRSISKELGCSYSLVQRHMKNHLKGQADKVRQALDTKSVDIVAELEKLYSTCDSYLKKAELANDWQQARAFIAEGRQTLRVIAEVQGKIKDITVQMNVFSNPQIFVLIEQIQSALEPWPQAKLAVAKALDKGDLTGA